MTATVTFTPAPAPPQAWQKVHLGGLGYVTGMAAAPDGSWLLAKTDVGGFYRRASGDTAWTQIVTSAGFPSTLADPENFLNSANTVGCWEIAMAGNNSTAYATFKAKILKTTDSGVTWTDTNFALVGGTNNDMPANQQSFERLSVNKMVVDPSDPNTVLVWTPKTGAYRTVDGGANWTQPTGLPDVSGQTAGLRIGVFACDRGSTVGSGRVWFAFAYGFGLYRSTDNGATWSLADATYTQAYDITYMASGVVWIAEQSAVEDNVRIWTQGTGWSSITSTPSGFKARYTSRNPNNSSDIILSTGGNSGNFMVRSQDGGATWTSAWAPSHMKSQHVETRTMSYAQDQDGATSFAMSFAKPIFHPTDGYVYYPTGYGAARSIAAATGFQAPNTSDKLVVYDFTAGMEELAAIFGRILPDGTIVTVQQDKTVLKIADPTTYALPGFLATTSLGAGYYADYVEGTPAKLAYASGGGAGGNTLDGYSDDGGATGVAFATQPVNGIGGGSILRFDDQRFIRLPGQNRRPRYTTDKGATWNIPTFTGGTLPADGTINGFGSGLVDFNQRCVAKDRDNPGVAYCYNFGEGGSNTMLGCWKSTDYGATWTNQTTSLILTSGTQGGHTTLIHADGVLYLTAGSTGSGYMVEATTNYLFRSTDQGVTWTAIRTSTGFAQEVTKPIQIGVGAHASGSSNKTIWMVGWVGHDLGVWYSADKGLTWTKLGDLPGFDSVQYIGPDPTTFGRLLIGGSGTGHWIRT
jgi:hypothetical protein